MKSKNIIICGLLLLNSLLIAQQGLSYPSATAPSEKILYINNKVLHGFSGLKKGKCIIDELLKPASGTGNNADDFCRDFQKVLKGSSKQFAALKKTKIRDANGMDIYEPTIKLLPDATCEIYESYLGSSYICEMLSANKASLQANFARIEKNVESCGAKITKAINRDDSDPGLVQKTEFELSESASDVNANTQRTHKIMLLLRTREKSFYMRLIID